MSAAQVVPTPLSRRFIRQLVLQQQAVQQWDPVPGRTAASDGSWVCPGPCCIYDVLQQVPSIAAHKAAAYDSSLLTNY
jgi:hypothetical protein